MGTARVRLGREQATEDLYRRVWPWPGHWQVWFLPAGMTMGVMGAGAFFVPAIVQIENKLESPKAGQTGIGDAPAIPATR